MEGNAILFEDSGVFARLYWLETRSARGTFKGAVEGGTRGDCTRGPGLGVREDVLEELREPLCKDSGEVVRGAGLVDDKRGGAFTAGGRVGAALGVPGRLAEMRF